MGVRDPKLPFLRIAWSEPEMARFLNTRVLPELSPGRQLDRVRAIRMTYKPGKACIMLYALSWAARPGTDEPAVPPFAVVSLHKDDRLKEVYKPLGCANGAAVAATPTAPAGTYVGDVRALVEFFPADWGLPHLAAATDMHAMGPLLDSAAAGNRHTVLPARWTCTPLRYHPQDRCVLAYTAAAADGFPARQLVGKLYRKGSKAQRAWVTLRALSLTGAGAAGWHIPVALAHVPEHNLVLMEYLHGISLKHLLRSGGRQARLPEQLKSAASMLAALHRLPGGSAEPRTIDSDRAKLQARLEETRAAAPELFGRLEALLAAIARHADRLPAAPMSLIHGGFTPNQLMIHETRVSLLDFDEVCAGDPALDVGNFIASMHKCQRKVSDRGALENLSELFVEEYQKQSSDREIGRRARLVKCQELVNYAVRSFLRRAYRFEESPDSARPAQLLEEAATCLARL